MLDMALEYQEVVIAMTKQQQNGLWEFELSNDKWEILGKLHKVLKVTVTMICHIPKHFIYWLLPLDP